MLPSNKSSSDKIFSEKLDYTTFHKIYNLSIERVKNKSEVKNISYHNSESIESV